MKILVVDDEIAFKCKGLILECHKRGIKLEVATNQREVFRKLSGNFDGIILDMAFPMSDVSDLVDLEAGERILKELQREKSKVPVLIFSRLELLETYPNVFDQMKYWDVEEERQKFFKFIEYLEQRK